jgi:glutamine synthetase
MEMPLSMPGVEELFAQSHVSKVKVGGFDLDGVLRGKYISRDKFLSAAQDGLGFCDVIFGWDCADNLYGSSEFTGWHTGFPDLQARLDLSTLRAVPWEPQTALCLADFYQRNGEPLPFCPRQTLKRIVARAESAGYRPQMSAEYEFFVFDESPASAAAKDYRGLAPESPGMFCYSLLRASARSEFVHDAMDSLAQIGVELEGFHTETGPGAFEVAIRYTDALTAADRAGIFKATLKEIAARHGLLVSFMAKWSADMPGCGGHIHQSLLAEQGNAFFDSSEPDGCSQTARSYIAGQQQLLPEIMPLICPTINSYKRLVPGFWAPTTTTWGIENRTNSIRLIPGSPKSSRVETRIAGADACPHLAMSACLAAGLYGIEREMRPTAPTVGNAYAISDAPALPRTLSEATDRMRRSAEAVELFGEQFVRHICTSRDSECREFEKAVTDWELRRYFEII